MTFNTVTMWEAIGAIVTILTFLFVIFIEWPRFKERINEIRSALIIFMICSFMVLHIFTFIWWPQIWRDVAIQFLYGWLCFLMIGGIYSVWTFSRTKNISGRLFQLIAGMVMITGDIVLWGLTRHPINDLSWWFAKQAVHMGLWGHH